MNAWVLLALSLFLLGLEFFLPGGILAICASMTYIVAIVCALNQFTGVSLAIYSLCSIAMPAITIYFILQRIRKSGDANTFFLAQNQEGYQGASFDKDLIGKVGVAMTDLGSSGFASIEGKRIQVISQGTYIEKGKQVFVVGGKGAYLVVKEVTE